MLRAALVGYCFYFVARYKLVEIFWFGLVGYLIIRKIRVCRFQSEFALLLVRCGIQWLAGFLVIGGL